MIKPTVNIKLQHNNYSLQEKYCETTFKIINAACGMYSIYFLLFECIIISRRYSDKYDTVHMNLS